MVPRPTSVLGVLAGGDMPLDQLAAWANSADRLFAADGGADRLLAAGVRPNATIGDLDSLRGIDDLEHVFHEADQDSSDCDKLLGFVARQGYPSVTLTGVEGDRLDHMLGTLSSAIRSPVAVRLALRRGLGWVLKGPTTLELTTAAGELVSLLPLEPTEGVEMAGVAWPLAGASLAASGLISLSNRTVGDRLVVRLEKGAALLTLLTERLESPSW